MNKGWCIFIFILALFAIQINAQTPPAVIPFSTIEDTMYIPDLTGTGLYLSQIIIDDTSGNSWQGSNGRNAWLNHTRVYVLQKGGYYPWSAQIQVKADRKLVIRAEDGKYPFPRGENGDYRPVIHASYGTGTAYPGSLIRLTGSGDTCILQNVVVSGIDEVGGSLNNIQGNLLEIASAATNSSFFLDGCIVKTDNGQLMQIGAGGAVHANTIRAINTIFGDMGFLGMSNFGAGRGIDLRNSEIDTLDVRNCTFVNWQDRTLRHYISLYPIHNIIIKHNTFVNGMSYHGMFSFGWVDSTGNGTFEIKDNLFLDNFAMGPDTDRIRQSEFVDGPDLDPLNGLSKACWIVARPNTQTTITPWDIAYNYYGISDSGLAIRNMSAPYLYVPQSVKYPGEPEPILTSDIWRQLKENGKDSALAFIKIDELKLKQVPPLMTKMIRWYYTIKSYGDTLTGEGAGAGREKTGSSGTPATNFRYVNGIWIYDYNRRGWDWYMDSLDCSFYANTNPTSSDGQVVGATYWSYLGPPPSSVDKKDSKPLGYEISQNYPNPFNPTTSFKYSIEKPGFVSIKVYNVLGQEVATLVNEYKKQAGTYNVTWDASGMNSGIYFYKMQSGNFSETRKMVLLK